MKRLLYELKMGENEAVVFLRLLRCERTLKELEEMTSLRQPQVSLAVSCLEKRGLVQKHLLPLPEHRGRLRQGRPEKSVRILPDGLKRLIGQAEHLMGDYGNDIKSLKGYLSKSEMRP